MVELLFKFNYPKNTKCNCDYKLIQFNHGEPWKLFSMGGTLIGSLEKVNGVWEQTGGRQTLDEIVTGAGELIENNGK